MTVYFTTNRPGTHSPDGALRDIELCLGAFGLAKLTEAMLATGVRTRETDIRLEA